MPIKDVILNNDYDELTNLYREAISGQSIDSSEDYSVKYSRIIKDNFREELSELSLNDLKEMSESEVLMSNITHEVNMGVAVNEYKHNEEKEVLDFYYALRDEIKLNILKLELESSRVNQVFFDRIMEFPPEDCLKFSQTRNHLLQNNFKEPYISHSIIKNFDNLDSFKSKINERLEQTIDLRQSTQDLKNYIDKDHTKFNQIKKFVSDVEMAQNNYILLGDKDAFSGPILEGSKNEALEAAREIRGKSFRLLKNVVTLIANLFAPATLLTDKLKTNKTKSSGFLENVSSELSSFCNSDDGKIHNYENKDFMKEFIDVKVPSPIFDKRVYNTANMLHSDNVKDLDYMSIEEIDEEYQQGCNQ